MVAFTAGGESRDITNGQKGLEGLELFKDFWRGRNKL